MKRLAVVSLFLLPALALMPATSEAAAAAQQVISNGGESSSGGGLTLHSTVGQTAIGVETAAGTTHRLGFWEVPLLLHAPTLAPIGGTVLSDNTPTLDWFDVIGANSYTLEYAQNVGFAGSTVVASLATSTYTFPTLADGTYYWRVQAFGPNAESVFSASDSFGISVSTGGAPPPPEPEPEPEPEPQDPAILNLLTQTVDFGDVLVGDSKDLILQVSNTGEQTSTSQPITLTGTQGSLFELSTSALNVAGGQTRSVIITFTPTAPGDVSVVMNIDFGTASFQPTIIGVGAVLAPEILTRNTMLNFGLGELNNPATQEIWVGNAGNDNLSITNIEVDETIFTVTPKTFEVAAGDSQLVTVTFLRSALGDVMQTLIILTNDPETPTATITLRGESGVPQIAVGAEDVRFDDVSFEELPQVGDEIRRELTVQNEGRLPLTLTSIVVSQPSGGGDPLEGGEEADMGPAFSVTVETATIEPDSSLQIEIIFAPTVSGSFEAVLTLISDDPENPEITVGLFGATVGSVGPRMVVANRFNVGAVELGTTKSLTITIQNEGDSQLTVVPAPEDTARFSTAPDSLVIGPGEGAVVTLTFDASVEGPALSSLALRSNDAMFPELQVAILAYAGVPPEGPITPDFILAPGDQGQRVGGSAEPGMTFTWDLTVTDAPEISGWSATLEYDTTQLAYIGGSFEVTSFISNLVAIVDQVPGQLTVGGALLGSDVTRSGSGSLGQVTFEVLEGFDESADIVITEIAFRHTDVDDEVQIVQATATITAEVIEVQLIGDFDANSEVNLFDFFLFADAFGGNDPDFDLDSDGRVGILDFFIFADNFGTKAQ